MSLPKVSCYCATYGRPHVLEESVESFLRQNYSGEKELIVLNDFAKNILKCDDPQVKIFNVPNHIKPLGKKFNSTVSLCTGDVFMPWEDDDIFLPHRLTYTVNNMQNGFFHTGLAFFEHQNKLIISGNHFHCNMAVSKELWKSVGGYSELDNCTLDIELMHRLKKESNYKDHEIKHEDLFYIYRWGGRGSYHASGWGSNPGTMVSNNVENFMSDRDVVGEYTLKPFWKYDYLEAAQKALSEAK
jgi:glycosyltransferase involved in cell wall biosynthesis